MKSYTESSIYESSRTYDDEPLPVTAELGKLLESEVSDRAHALERIKQMWDDFDLEEYMQTYSGPQEDLRNSRRLSESIAVDATMQSDSPSWRHRVTIPEPFEMTMRDEIASRRKEEKVEQLKREKLEKERMVEAELQAKRQFRANPVPAHVYLPIYDELARTQEQRRQFVVEHSQQLLRSLQKPFKFTLRHNTSRSLQRCSSLTEMDKAENTTAFRANPIPPSTYDQTIAEKLREQELYRKIQSRIRAIELYRSAAAPPSMEARRKAQQDLLADRLRTRAASAERPGERSRTFVNPQVFDRLSQPNARPPLPKSRFMPPEPEVYEEPSRNKFRPRSAAESLAAGRRALRTETAPPHKLTTSSELRMTRTQQRLASEREIAEREQLMREHQQQRRREMARLVKERGQGLTPRSAADPQDKYKERSRELHERSQQYQRYLEDIDQKLASRPLLVERVAADVARKQAAQRYREALERVGLTEDEVLHSTTIAAEYNNSIGRNYDTVRTSHSRNTRERNDFKDDYDLHSHDIQESPIAPHSPEDDYAF